jgi:hypothetical protein
MVPHERMYTLLSPTGSLADPPPQYFYHRTTTQPVESMLAPFFELRIHGTIIHTIE